MRLEGTEASPSDLAGQYTNGNGASTSHKSSISSLANGSSANGNSNGTKTAASRPNWPFFAHDREEVTRILIQGLTDLGYNGAAAALSRESGYELENTSVAAFRNAIEEGEWAEAEALLFGQLPDTELSTPISRSLSNLAGSSHGASAGLPLAEGANKKEMLFLIRQQKYLELLEQRDLGSALTILRQEITPLHQGTDRLHALSSLMMCPTVQDLRRQAEWSGAQGGSRLQLLSELSTSIAPSVMIPEHRLAVLFDKVQQNQRDACLYHSTTAKPSLYHDHTCDRNDFPLEPLRELTDSTGEVWYVAFSPKGTYIATATSNDNIFIYNTSNWSLVHRFADQHNIPDVHGIAFLSWSPNEDYLISCSLAKSVSIYSLADGGRIQAIDGYEHEIGAASWFPTGNSFVVASHDKTRPLDRFQLGQPEPTTRYLSSRAGIRVRGCKVSATGDRLAAITAEKRLLIFDTADGGKTMLNSFAMDEYITGFDLSPTGDQALLSMCGSQLRLIDTATGAVVQSYTAQKQIEFVVRAALGGAADGFVITGSEDSHVYIYRRHSGALVAALPAHEHASVNAVAWHPTNPGMFATGGDDRKVIIWGSHAEAERSGRR